MTRLACLAKTTRVELLAAVVVAATAVLSAQTVAPQSPAAPARDSVASAPSGAAIVSGVVVDDENKPVRRASVTFEGDGRANRIALTDDKGAFVAANLPAARYTIRAERAGFASGEYGAKRGPTGCWPHAERRRSRRERRAPHGARRGD